MLSDIIKVTIHFVFKTICYMVLSLISLILDFSFKNLFLLTGTIIAIQYTSVTFPYNYKLHMIVFITFLYVWRKIGKDFYNRGEESVK